MPSSISGKHRNHRAKRPFTPLAAASAATTTSKSMRKSSIRLTLQNSSIRNVYVTTEGEISLRHFLKQSPRHPHIFATTKSGSRPVDIIFLNSSYAPYNLPDIDNTFSSIVNVTLLGQILALHNTKAFSGFACLPKSILKDKKKAYARVKQIARFQGKRPPPNPYPSAVREIQAEERKFVRDHFHNPVTLHIVDTLRQDRAQEMMDRRGGGGGGGLVGRGSGFIINSSRRPKTSF